jgi:3-methyladenine DNA glycosylase AlkD
MSSGTFAFNYVKELRKHFELHADDSIAPAMKAYMRSQFEFMGLKSPVRKEASKEFLKSHTHPAKEDLKEVIEELWIQPEREFQYFGMELFYSYRKLYEVKDIQLLEFMITTKSWWDTVDFIATAIVGAYMKMFPRQIPAVTVGWNRSSNFWLQRTSLLFQLKYKGETDTQLLSSYIKHLIGSEEFFIRKAIGWVLREYSKTDPNFVKKFVEENTLSTLSKKEALKRM